MEAPANFYAKIRGGKKWRKSGNSLAKVRRKCGGKSPTSRREERWVARREAAAGREGGVEDLGPFPGTTKFEGKL